MVLKSKFTLQLIIGLLIGVIGMVCATVFQSGMYANVGWSIYGLLFVVHPVCPVGSESIPHIKWYIRLTGIALVVISISANFGVS